MEGESEGDALAFFSDLAEKAKLNLKKPTESARNERENTTPEDNPDEPHFIRRNFPRPAQEAVPDHVPQRMWFVRLRFPGHKHTRIIDGVPEGWERKTFGDICTEIRDTIIPDEVESDTPYIGLGAHPETIHIAFRMGHCRGCSQRKALGIWKGTFFSAKFAPIFIKLVSHSPPGITSSDAIVIRPNYDNLRVFVLMTVSSDTFVAEASQTMREGSKMPRADWKLMTKYPIAMPHRGLLENFTETVTGITDQLRTLCFQNQKLRSARVLLLPKLMSGEIKVENYG